jgi:hypothetical protein
MSSGFTRLDLPCLQRQLYVAHPVVTPASLLQDCLPQALKDIGPVAAQEALASHTHRSVSMSVAHTAARLFRSDDTRVTAAIGRMYLQFCTAQLESMADLSQRKYVDVIHQVANDFMQWMLKCQTLGFSASTLQELWENSDEQLPVFMMHVQERYDGKLAKLRDARFDPQWDLRTRIIWNGLLSGLGSEPALPPEKLDQVRDAMHALYWSVPDLAASWDMSVLGFAVLRESLSLATDPWSPELQGLVSHLAATVSTSVPAAIICQQRLRERNRDHLQLPEAIIGGLYSALQQAERWRNVAGAQELPILFCLAQLFANPPETYELVQKLMDSEWFGRTHDPKREMTETLRAAVDIMRFRAGKPDPRDWRMKAAEYRRKTKQFKRLFSQRNMELIHREADCMAAMALLRLPYAYGVARELGFGSQRAQFEQHLNNAQTYCMKSVADAREEMEAERSQQPAMELKRRLEEADNDGADGE